MDRSQPGTTDEATIRDYAARHWNENSIAARGDEVSAEAGAGAGGGQSSSAVPQSSTVEQASSVEQARTVEIAVPESVQAALGLGADDFRRGCEAEQRGLGAGAVTYYLRALEGAGEGFLADVGGLLQGSEREDFLRRLNGTAGARNRLESVQELAPALVCPGGANSLQALAGLMARATSTHADRECLQLAAELRESLIYLVGQVEVAQRLSPDFIHSLRLATT